MFGVQTLTESGEENTTAQDVLKSLLILLRENNRLLLNFPRGRSRVVVDFSLEDDSASIESEANVLNYFQSEDTKSESNASEDPEPQTPQSNPESTELFEGSEGVVSPSSSAVTQRDNSDMPFKPEIKRRRKSPIEQSRDAANEEVTILSIRSYLSEHFKNRDAMDAL